MSSCVSLKDYTCKFRVLRNCRFFTYQEAIRLNNQDPDDTLNYVNFILVFGGLIVLRILIVKQLLTKMAFMEKKLSSNESRAMSLLGSSFYYFYYQFIIENIFVSNQDDFDTSELEREVHPNMFLDVCIKEVQIQSEMGHMVRGVVAYG